MVGIGIAWCGGRRDSEDRIVVDKYGVVFLEILRAVGTIVVVEDVGSMRGSSGGRIRKLLGNPTRLGNRDGNRVGLGMILCLYYWSGSLCRA